MKKIGIITYHWAINYGAVLQAYALRRYLINKGYEVEFINYRPLSSANNLKKNLFKFDTVLKFKRKFDTYIRMKKFEEFRTFLVEGKEKYTNINELRNNPPKYDIYITGSDQVWNPNYSYGDEIAYPYFLDFGNNIKKISYAPSLGVGIIPDNLKEQYEKAINKINNISVREKDSVKLLEDLGIENVNWVPDPTFLLDKSHYVFKGNKIKEEFIFSYILHDYKEPSEDILKYVGKIIDVKIKNVKVGTKFKLNNLINKLFSPEEWVNNLSSSKFVITNSFHCVVFSLIFHKPFIVIGMKGAKSGMNNRLHSMLSFFDLQDRIIVDFDESNLDELVNKKIDWKIIDSKLLKWKDIGRLFLEKSLK